MYEEPCRYELWVKAMLEEIASIIKNGTWNMEHDWAT